MYLSRLTLNPRSAQVRSELARPYEMHRTLSKAFPPDTFRKTRDDDDAAGVLFRVDESPREQRIAVLVQSHSAPDWSFLIDRCDARGHAYLLRPPETKSFGAHLTAGQTLAFRLRANPTKRLGKGAGDDHHKRVGIYDEDKQLEWLREKFEGNPDNHRQPSGFRLIRAMVSREDRIENAAAIPRGEQKHDLKMLSVQFDGILQVLDAAHASETVARSIGSGKGFGFGLLSLAPA